MSEYGNYVKPYGEPAAGRFQAAQVAARRLSGCPGSCWAVRSGAERGLGERGPPRPGWCSVVSERRQRKRPRYGAEGLRLVIDGRLIEEPVPLALPQVLGVGHRGLERGRAGGQPEAFQDPLGYRGIFDCRNESHPGTAPRALQRVYPEDALK